MNNNNKLKFLLIHLSIISDKFVDIYQKKEKNKQTITIIIIKDNNKILFIIYNLYHIHIYIFCIWKFIYQPICIYVGPIHFACRWWWKVYTNMMHVGIIHKFCFCVYVMYVVWFSSTQNLFIITYFRYYLPKGYLFDVNINQLSTIITWGLSIYSSHIKYICLLYCLYFKGKDIILPYRIFKM